MAIFYILIFLSEFVSSYFFRNRNIFKFSQMQEGNMAFSRYSITNDDIKSIHAKLLYVTYSRYENDWSSLPHAHHFTELCYIRKGNGKYLIDDECYPVRKDDFIIINSNVSHTEVSEPSAPMEYIILGVEGLDFFANNSRGHFIFNCHENQSDFLVYMNILLNESESRQPNYELVCQNLLEVLIVNLLRYSNLDFKAVPTIRASLECNKLKHYIDSNYMQDITLDTLAEISHLNKYYMVHAFTNLYGRPPVSYLCDVRIRACKELLATTDLSITEIAHCVGFSSHSYFAQCFRKRCGMTARQYRKSCAQK